MTTPKSWINAFFAWMHNEVDASPLEAYQRAGNVVFNLVLEAEMQRQQGMSLWDTPAHLQIQNLCLWNALVLQTLGDQVLNADYRLNPSTVGYVPVITAKQIENFYQPVETWLNHAYQAQKNTQFSIKELGTPLPALLPTWLNVKEMLSSKRHKAEISRYLDGILSAAKTLALQMDVHFEQLSLGAVDVSGIDIKKNGKLVEL